MKKFKDYLIENTRVPKNYSKQFLLNYLSSIINKPIVNKSQGYFYKNLKIPDLKYYNHVQDLQVFEFSDIPYDVKLTIVGESIISESIQSGGDRNTWDDAQYIVDIKTAKKYINEKNWSIEGNPSKFWAKAKPTKQALTAMKKNAKKIAGDIIDLYSHLGEPDEIEPNNELKIYDIRKTWNDEKIEHLPYVINQKILNSCIENNYEIKVLEVDGEQDLATLKGIQKEIDKLKRKYAIIGYDWSKLSFKQYLGRYRFYLVDKELVKDIKFTAKIF